MIRILKWLSVVATIIMVFILLGGALVTKTDSGAGCGKSWPLCHGELIPSEITPELIIELSHRLVSGIGGIVILLLAFLAWKYVGHLREVKFLSIVSVVFLLLQGLIGAAAVVWGQSDFVLALHFGISLISFASVFLLTLLIFEIDKKLDTANLVIKKKHRIEIVFLAIYTLVTVYTGALVRHTNANLVCKDWPFCFNQTPFAFFNYNMEQWIQMGHRLAAGILFFWTLSLFIRLMKQYRDNQVMYWGSILLIVLISSQVIFGALIIFTLLNLGIALLHALFISCYFALLCYFLLLASRSAQVDKVKAGKKAKMKEELIYP